MARTGYYDDNGNRSYPFLQDEEFAPNSAIVDCGFLMGFTSGFVAGQHTVFLFQIRREGAVFEFEFRSDAPGLLDKAIIFTREVGAPDYEVEFQEVGEHGSISESASVSGSESETGCNVDVSWSGFMVSGELQELVNTLASGESLTGQANVEPAVLRDLNQSYARSLNFANGDRTRASNAEDCKDICFPTEPQPLFIRAACITGPIRLFEGFNMVIQQDGIDNSITLSAAVGAGAGEPCQQVPVFAGEVPPDGSNLLEGGPDCNDVIRSINGVGGKVVDVIGGRGVDITAKPEQNELLIDINMSALALCFAESIDWQNPINQFDVNNDGEVTQADVQAILDYITENGEGELPLIRPANEPFVDVTGDGTVTAADAQAVTDFLDVQQQESLSAADDPCECGPS